MIKFKYFPALEEFSRIDFAYDETGISYTSGSRTAAKYSDESGGITNGNTIVFHGQGLKYLMGELVGGTVDGVTFSNGTPGRMLEVTNIDFKAKVLYDLLISGSDGLETMLRKLHDHRDASIGSPAADYMEGGKANDTLRGYNGNDFLDGGGGNDVLTGDKGSDTFLFSTGHDKVTDFDGVGGGNLQDYIQVRPTDIGTLSWAKQGKDVVVTFQDGHTMTLLDTHYADIDNSDFTSVI